MAFQENGRDVPMSMAFQARDWTREMEAREKAKTGLACQHVRPIIARRVGTTPSAIEHVSRGRAKGITATLFAAIQRAFIKTLIDEISRAEHAIQVARACGVDPRSDEMAALQAGAEAARKLMENAP